VRSCRRRGLKRLFERDDRSGIRALLVDTVQEILTVLGNAAAPQELNLPGDPLHPPQRHARLRVTAGASHGRIIFRFQESAVFDVELTDCH